MTLSFWTNEPSIIFNKDYILQIWPTQQMTFEAKLNAISRLIIIISILAFILTGNWNLIIIGFITLAIIFALYKLRKQQLVSSIVKQEGFATNKRKEQKASKTTTNPVTLETLLRTNFHPTTKQNPFGNVLLTDINDNPNRLAAAPSFNPDVYDEIDSAVKKQTQMLNPDIINTNKQLYGDLYDNYTLDNSMMRFYSTANSRVSNDQGAFAKWLYGTMPSGKESGPDGALARVQDNYQWINP
jgi:hypothetical protein